MADDFTKNGSKFPLYVFNPRHGMTLPHRTADLSRYFLEKRILRLRVEPPAQQAAYIYRTLVCEGNLKLGLLSFASLAACAKRWPKIEMLVDESISPNEVRDFYEQHGISVDVWTPARLLEHLNDDGRTVLRRFAEIFFWGRKTAFTFAVHEKVPILYADLDILWFQDPWKGLNLAEMDQLLASEDRVFSYNKEFLPLLSVEYREMLFTGAPYCAGLYAVPPGFQLPEEILGYISQRLDMVSHGYCYEESCAIEQTCLGLAAKLKGRGIPWNRLPTCPDDSAFFPSYHRKNWVAAHYAGPTRRQFWRDAWTLLK
jgi:hypothetical protein